MNGYRYHWVTLTLDLKQVVTFVCLLACAVLRSVLLLFYGRNSSARDEKELYHLFFARSHLRLVKLSRYYAFTAQFNPGADRGSADRMTRDMACHQPRLSDRRRLKKEREKK